LNFKFHDFPGTVRTPKIKHLGIVVAGLFTGQMPFLSANEQHQTTECQTLQKPQTSYTIHLIAFAL